MPKIGSSRPKTVAALKKPAPKAKTEKQEAPKSTGWSARTTAGGRGSDVSTPGSREAVANQYAGGRGSDRSTSETRQRVADIYSGGRGS